MVVLFLRAGAVIRIVRILAVACRQAGRQHRVVERALQPVAILRTAGKTNQVSRQFQVGKAAAGRLEMGFGTLQTLGELALAEVNELLLRRPPSGREALRLEEAPGVGQRFQVLRVTEVEIRLRAGTEADRVAVGMLLRQDVDAGGQRVEPLLVEEVVHRQLVVPVVAGDPRDVKQVFRDDVGLVVGRIPLADAVARHRRNVGQTFVNRDGQQVLRFLDAAQLKGVDEPDDVFVHDVGGPLRLRIGPGVRDSRRAG